MPSGQVTENCHYISRFLTKPWEAEQRRLRFYNFDTERFERGFSYSLFAEDKLNPQHVETWLDQIIEGPLSICRKKLGAGELDALEDWRFYRAATLMLWFQGIRVRSIEDHDARRSLEHLATRTKEETDQLVVAIRDEYDLALVYTVSKGTAFAPLFFPSSGIFRFTYPDTGCLSGHSIGLGLPLDLRSALVALPRDQAGVRDVSRIPGSISNCSVGTSNARLVVVPPLMLEQQAERDVALILSELRTANDFLVKTVHEAKDLVVMAFDESGIQAPRDGSGRIPPRK